MSAAPVTLEAMSAFVQPVLESGVHRTAAYRAPSRAAPVYTLTLLYAMPNSIMPNTRVKSSTLTIANSTAATPSSSAKRSLVLT